MIYHNLGSDVDHVLLEDLHAQRVGDVIQWHRDDYTLEFRARFEELAVLESADVEDARNEILKECGHALVGESAVDGQTTFYGFEEIEEVDRPPFAEDAAGLIEVFVDAIVTMPDDLNTDSHRALVDRLRCDLALFLSDYSALEHDDIARYISKIGIPEEKARRDLDLILELYE